MSCVSPLYRQDEELSLFGTVQLLGAVPPKTSHVYREDLSVLWLERWQICTPIEEVVQTRWM